MRSALWLCALTLSAAATAHAQQRDTTARRDTTRKSAADSAAAADSAFLERALKGDRPSAQPPASDTTRPTGASAGATNPRLLPDISAVGDLIGDLSPKGSTQEDGSRFGVREIELAIQAAVDPYFRGDVFLGVSDLEKISIEQAFLTTTSLPYGLELRIGRYLMPFGKENTTHREALHTLEYSYVTQRFLGPEGLKGTGLWASRVFAPFGFYQELMLTAVDRLGEAPEGVTTEEPVNRRLSGLAYSARLRNYWDLGESANLELSGSAITGRRERAIERSGVAAVGRQSVVAADATYRWRPLQQGLYRSFVLRGEVMRQLNATNVAVPETSSNVPVTFVEPLRTYTGGYAFARWQTTRRTFLGGRFDALQDPTQAGMTLHAVSGYLEVFPSEFSKLIAGYEHLDHPTTGVKNRLVFQAVFAMGPHAPHPF